MYKSRIKKWGLDKKTKEAEAWALLRIKMRRDAVGKNSAFGVRGKPVTIEDVLRYFKRKGILDPEVVPQPHEASTPPAIDYWTPIPSPKPGNTTVQAPEQEIAQREADLFEVREQQWTAHYLRRLWTPCRPTTICVYILTPTRLGNSCFPVLRYSPLKSLIRLCPLNVFLCRRSSSLVSRPIMTARSAVGFSNPMTPVISLRSTRQLEISQYSIFTSCVSPGLF